MRSAYVAIGRVLAGVACTVGGVAARTSATSDPASSAPDGGPSAGAPLAGVGSATPGPRRYQTTASAGDFLQITLDKAARTVSYLNTTNGLAAADVPYELDALGAYSFRDPNGHLVAAIELEDQVLVVDVARAGPQRDTRALAIGAVTRPIARTDFASRRLNAMRLRTRTGGVEIGSVVIAADVGGVRVELESYWPRGAMLSGGAAFHVGGAAMLAVAETSGAHEFLTATETHDGVARTDHLFRTASGFAIDLADGNLVMLDQPASPEFDPRVAGSYLALAYAKRGARGTAGDQPEPGVASVGLVDLIVDGAGHLRATDADGVRLFDHDLVPVAEAAHLTGAGRLDAGRTKGLFTFRTTGGGGPTDVFVIFTKDGLLFSSFTPGASDGGEAPYDYLYGAAVRPR
jgi:hypothetical protein